MKTINYDHIIDNLSYLKGKYHKEILFVVKNNAYNTGLSECIKHCMAKDLKSFVVTSMAEGLIIRKIAPTAYILVMNPTNEEEIRLAEKNNLALSITSYDWYKKYQQQLKNIKLHLKVNVGMNRFGLNDIKQINEIISNNSNVEGLFTHFATVEEDKLLFKQQAKCFKEIYEAIEQVDNLKYIHSENSAALLLNEPLLLFCNYARVGICGYGYSPTIIDNNLKAALYLTSKIIYLNKVCANSLIGYGCDNLVEQDTLIGICPIGYGDGLSKIRKILPVMINQKPYRVIAISMSHLIIEVDENVNLNDQVEIYGDNIKVDHLRAVSSVSCSEIMTCLK